MALGGLLSLGTGLLGAASAYSGHRQQMGLAKQPSKSDLESTFSGTQGLIDRMTNFNQYSGGAMDLATQAGNQGVQDAMMMGMGGSQANAIKHRLKQSGVNNAYQSFQGGLGKAAQLQSGIDSNIAGQMAQNRHYSNMIKNQGAQRMMGIGQNLMGPEGVSGLLGSIGTVFG